jgi:YebC/PmpR family DNA-binding regulatory protein
MGRMFEVRKAAIFARMARNSKAFSKIGKEIQIAVKLSGSDPASNPRLRIAIKNARAVNMPKDSVEAAIKRASGKDATNLEELTYEGYGPHGVGIFIESSTDNPTRTVANIRSYFNKCGGALATNGALDFLFNRRGVFNIVAPSGDLEEFELELIDHGLEDLFQTEDGSLLVYCGFSEYGSMQKILEAKNVEIKSASLTRLPTTTAELTADQITEVEKLINMLEEDDDVQHVYSTLKSE